MANEYYGETEVSPKELYQFSEGQSRLGKTFANLIFFLVFGLIGLVAMILLICFIGLVIIVGTIVVSMLFQSSGGFTFDADRGMMTLPGYNLYLSILGKYFTLRYLLFFAGFVFVLLKLIYHFILKPMARSAIYRTNSNLAAIDGAEAGSVKYKVDLYGLEYKIRSAKAENNYKLYWRNFTDAQYSPEVIRFFKGKKQHAFILMRAFPGREREVGQFIESIMNKIKIREN